MLFRLMGLPADIANGFLFLASEIVRRNWITDVEIDEFDAVMNTNVRGAWAVAREAGRRPSPREAPVTNAVLPSRR